MNKIKASSMVNAKIVTVQQVADDRMLSEMRAILDNP